MPVFKLSPKEKRSVCWLAEAGLKPPELAARFNVTRQYVYLLIKQEKADKGCFSGCDTCGAEGPRKPLNDTYITGENYCSVACEIAGDEALYKFTHGDMKAMDKLYSTKENAEKDALLKDIIG